MLRLLRKKTSRAVFTAYLVLAVTVTFCFAAVAAFPDEAFEYEQPVSENFFSPLVNSVECLSVAETIDAQPGKHASLRVIAPFEAAQVKNALVLSSSGANAGLYPAAIKNTILLKLRI